MDNRGNSKAEEESLPAFSVGVYPLSPLMEVAITVRKKASVYVAFRVKFSVKPIGPVILPVAVTCTLMLP